MLGFKNFVMMGLIKIRKAKRMRDYCSSGLLPPSAAMKETILEIFFIFFFLRHSVLKSPPKVSFYNIAKSEAK